MVGKNNKDLLTRRMSKRVTRWGIRRLNIGVASIAIASGFLLSSGLSEIAQAAEVQPQAAIEAASDTTTSKDGLQASDDEKAERHTNDQATMAVARPSDDETVADNKADESAIADDEATVENKADDKAAEDDHATADRAADDDKAAADETANDQLDGSEETPKPQAVRASEYTVPDYTQKDSISHVTNLDNNFTKYGDIERFPYDYGEVHTEVLRFNNHNGTGAVNSVLQLDGKIDFSKDFTMKFEIAAEPQGITTGPDGFGFTFYNDTPENLKNAGGILNKQGLANAWGFRYDTGYHYDDPNDVKAKQAAAGYRGYGAFASNDGSGTTTVVGDINTFYYVSNAATGFRGQNLTPLTISYNAATQTMTVTYAQYTWTTTLKALGVDPTQNYGFAITSEKENGRYSTTGMRIRAVSADGIIDYTPEAKEQHATITYVDDTTGQNLKVDEVKGNSGTNANYDSQSVINGYTNSGYTFVSSDIPNGGIVFDTVDDKDGNASQNFTIHLKHQTVPVTPENPNGTNVDQLLHSVTQTIHYVDNTGKTVSADVTDDVVFRREGVKDLVTGEVTLGQWTAVGNDNTFEAKKSPIVPGYYADRVQVNAETVTADSPNQVINVIYNKLGNLVPDVPGSKPVPYPNDPNDPTKPGKPQVPTYPGYTPIGPDGNPMAPGQTYPIDPTQPGKDTNIHYEPNIQHATVTYIDDVTKQTIYVENLTGGSGTKSQYTTADKIAELTGKGYQLVTDGYPTGGMTFDTDDYVNQNYEVHLTHKTVPVTPDKPEGTDINQLVHKVTQTVEYVYEDGKKAAETVIDEVTFERTGVKDLVTNTVTYGDWKAKGGDNTFDVKVSPTINGYTPDAAQIQETVVDATAQSKDQVHKVTYKRNQQNATVVYIDDVTKQPIYTETLTGQSGTKSPYTTADKIAELTGKGYELVKDGYPAGGMTFDTDDAKDQVYEVHFVHQTVPVTPENPNGTDISQLVHKVTQTVHYVDEAGQKVANDVTDEVTFQREGTKDLVSGQVTFGDWKAKDGDATFVAKVSPTINGYTTKTPEIAETTVAFDAQSKDHEHTVVYTKNDQKATVTFIDDVTKQPIHVETLTGKGGETSTYTTAQKIAELEKQGYKLVSNNFPTDGLIFDMDDTTDQAFEVHFEHQTKPVTPANPGDVDINELVHKVTQTVHYVDEAGQPVANDVTDEVTFERTGVKDLVTGDVTFEEWKAKDDDDTFEAKASPIVKGYYAEKAQVEAITVTVKDTKDEQTVVYHKLGSLIPVDKDGQPIPGVDKVPYPNHPTDPTKPGEPVIPTVPGFTPVDKDGTPLTPGTTYPVDPAKPGEDTTITYVADEQKVIVHYIDKTTGKEITTDTVSGKSGDKVNYSTADKIKELENKGYQLVSDGYPKDGLTFDNDKNTNQEYTVELAHRVVPVTPDKPGEPNKPVDPDNPDGPKYPEGTDKASLSKDITQTIKYVYEDGKEAAQTSTDKVTFERKGTVDLVTGDVTYTDWEAKDGDQTFDAKKSPVITGYYADRAQFEASDVLPDSTDQNYTVTYKKLGSLIPVDENGQPIPGADKVPYPNDPTDPTLPGNPVIPEIPGYTPVGPNGTPVQPGSTYPINPDLPGKDTEITYIADEQKVIVHYVDKTTGNEITAVEKDGKSGEKVDYSTAEFIQQLVNQGYELVSDGYPKDGVIFDNDKNVDQEFTVTLQHRIVPVTPDKPGEPNKPVDPDNPDGPKYPEGTDKDSLVDEVTETIKYVDEKGNPVAPEVTDTVTFEREGSVDLVTGKVTYTEWQAKDNDDTFDEKVSPIVKGYYTNEGKVEAITAVPGEEDHVIEVVYRALGSLIPVDENGQPIPGVDKVPYPNHPTDPTKPGEPVIPTIPGYTPVDKDGQPLNPGDTYPVDPTKPGEDTEITYKADDQKVLVHYVDKTTGTEITVETVSGKSGDKVNYSTADKIKELENKGYQLVSDGYPKDGLTFDNDKNTNQEYTVTLEHRVVPVTPEKPGEPNKPVDPDNPEGPKYPEGTDKDSLSKDVTQTVHYVDAEGNKVSDDVVDTVTFEREGSVDLVTGKVTYTDWKAKDGDNTFDAKVSPVIDGYYADKAQVDETTVEADAKNQEITVTYNKLGNLVPDVPGADKVPYPNDPKDPTKPGQPIIPDIPGYTPVGPDGKPLTPGDTYPIDPNKPGEDTPIHYEADDQVVTVHYVDKTTGQEITVDNIPGKSGDKVNYSTADKIKELENKGYQLVSDGYPKDGVIFDNDKNTNQEFTVTFEHRVVPVTPEKPGEPNKPVDPDNPEGPKYPEGTDVDSLVHKVTQTVHYVDAEGNEIAKDVVDTVTFEREGSVDLVTGKVTYTDWKAKDGDNTFDAKVSPVIDGYYADKAQVDETTVEADAKDQEITVTYNKLGNLVPDVPGADKVPYPNDPKDPTKPGQPIIPDIPGYTPVGPDGKPLTPGDTYPIDPNKPGEDTPIHYEADDQVVTVHYVDKTTGQEITVDNIPGKSGDKVNYSTADKIKELENKGYQLVSDGYPKDGVIFDNNKNTNQEFTVTLEHRVVPVTPEKPGEPNKPVDPDNPEGPKYPEGTDKDSLSKDVSQTVHYVDAEGNEVAKDVVDTVTFEREGSVDLVTGEVTYTDWKAKDGDDTFDAKKSPVIDGYYADKAQVDETTVEADAKDQEITVTYNKLGSLVPDVPGSDKVPYPNDPKDPTKPGQPIIPDIPGYTPVDPDGKPLKPGDTYPIDPEKPGEDTNIHYVPNKDANDQQAIVHYVDDETGKPLVDITLIGKPGETSDYRTDAKIQELINKGYVLVSDGYPKDGVVFDNDDSTTQEFTVHFKHGKVPVTPEKPGQPGEPVDPSNPEGPKYPEGTDVDSLVHKVTQTVHYVDKDGNEVAKDVVDTVTFEREGVVDLVTGEIVYTDWKAIDDDNVFDTKKSPVIEGFYADKAQVDEMTVTPDMSDQEITVTYNKLGHLVPDVPGVDPVPYPNDPTDPSKPGQPIIPDVPGYTPVDPDGNPLKPGDPYPVDPEKPGEDTPVHYEPNKLPDKPGKPDVPNNKPDNKPETPDNQPDVPDVPGDNGDNGDTNNVTPTPAEPTDQQMDDSTPQANLPQTGASTDNSSLFGGALLAIVGALQFGASSKKRKKEDE